MTSKQYSQPSYKDILLSSILHKEGIKKVNILIKESQTRFSMSKFNEEYNDLPQWCFGIDDGEKFIRFQCINCHICGEYIQCDVRGLPSKLYCNISKHHDIVHKKNEIFNIKNFLKIFDKTKQISYLQRAALHSIILSDSRMDIFYGMLIEYIGISFHAS
jgi:hypothetical protein